MSRTKWKSLKFLLNEISDKSKVKHIKYGKLECQKYLSSNLFSNCEVQLLSKMRTRNLDLKFSFKTQFTHNKYSQLKCSINGCTQIEDQTHILKCAPLWHKFNQKYKWLDTIIYDGIFSKSVKKQKKITKLYSILLDIRPMLIKNQLKACRVDLINN